MDRRRHKRIKKSMILEINEKPGKLIDISKSGLRVSTSLVKTPRDIDIVLHNNGKNFGLKGMIHWIRRKNPIQNSKEIGVRVKDAPLEYYNFLNTLNWGPKISNEYGWVLIMLSVMLFVGLIFGFLTFFDLIHF